MMRMRKETLLSLAFFASCAQTSHAAEKLPDPKWDLPAAKEGETRTAVFAAGCFWCSEAVFEQLEGVTEVVSGYAGDTKDNANYSDVSSGRTKHAEAIRVTYDSRITYGQLLKVLFTTHDPTTKDKQGPDWGHQYRSAIFFANEEEKRVASDYIKQLEEAKAFHAPIVTTIEPLDRFYAAEQYHQDFVKLHPDHGYVRAWAVPKVAKVHMYFKHLVKKR
jgi:peptide-methionine (S)-S-oxide reductase